MTHTTRRDLNAFSGMLLGSLLLSFAAGAQAQSAMDRIKLRGQVTIGYRVDAAPFSYADKSGAVTGYAVELCQPIAAKLATQAGIAPTAIRYLAVPGDQLERYVKGANVDLFCSATSDTAERRKSMDFSAPIYVASVKVLVRKQDKITAFAQLGGKAVSVIDRTTASAAVSGHAAKTGVAVTLAKAVNAEAALGQLKLGWAAGYARDDVLLAVQLSSLPEAAEYTTLADVLSSENIAIGMPPGDAALKALVQQALTDSAKSGQWAQTYERWFMKPVAPAAQALNLPMSAALQSSISALR